MTETYLEIVFLYSRQCLLS